MRTSRSVIGWTTRDPDCSNCPDTGIGGGIYCLSHSGVNCAEPDCANVPKCGIYCVSHSGVNCAEPDCSNLPRFGIGDGIYCVSHCGVTCADPDCSKLPRDGIGGGIYCVSHCGVTCADPYCSNLPRGGIGDGIYCQSHARVLNLPEDTVEGVDHLVTKAVYFFGKGFAINGGLFGTTGQDEINQDIRRMKKTYLNLNLEYFDQETHMVEKGLNYDSAHDTARDAERFLIRTIGLHRLLNRTQGGGGGNPNDPSIGGVFLIIFTVNKEADVDGLVEQQESEEEAVPVPSSNRRRTRVVLRFGSDNKDGINDEPSQHSSSSFAAIAEEHENCSKKESCGKTFSKFIFQLRCNKEETGGVR